MADNMPQCEICKGTGWVCENCKTVWQDDSGKSCCGAGEPCDCNGNGAFDFDAVISSTDPEAVKNWSH